MNHVVLIDCPDGKGLISKITNVLFQNDLNIVANGEYVDRQHNLFFMRTEVEGQVRQDKLQSELEAVLPAGAHVRISSQTPKKIVLIATKEAHCLGDLLVRCWHGGLNAHVQAVVSNHDVLKDLVNRFDIPYHFIPHEGMERRAHEIELEHILDAYQPDYIVLAKYMRILSEEFTAKYEHRMINIHHSFLPAFIGAKPYQQAFVRGVKIIGATAHFVNSDLDEGPIITQQVIPVDHAFSAEDMAKAGEDVEKITLSNALRLVLEDRVFVSGNRTVVFD
ncbi:MAG: formyltetrahydrofolate deformylase [Alphaproteobacteria bacterium]|nr:formyltetrahydrofolate deformylase [Alphaproteobacteria bacterium]